MLSSISQNNIDLMIKDLNAHKCSTLIIVDYAQDFKETLDFIVQNAPTIKHISYFCEHCPDTKILTVQNTTENRWSLKTFKTFLLNQNPVSFDHHTPVYKDDVSRLKAWRVKYMAGPFLRILNKLNNLPSINTASFAYTPLICTTGLLVQLLIPALRPQHGTVKAKYNNIDIDIYFNGSPEKDHYGESPLYAERLRLFEETASRYIHGKDHDTAFIFVTGPRHLYLQSTLDLAKTNKALFYACALYRPKAIEHG